MGTNGAGDSYVGDSWRHCRRACQLQNIAKLVPTLPVSLCSIADALSQLRQSTNFDLHFERRSDPLIELVCDICLQCVRCALPKIFGFRKILFAFFVDKLP